MAKAKYKLDQLVSYDDGTIAGMGTVTGVMTRKDGFSYELSDTHDLISESSITAAYRPVLTRTAKVASPKKRHKKSAAKTVESVVQ